MSAYMLFAPVFFANIGIALNYSSIVQNFSWTLVAFFVVFVIAGMLAKFIGCGFGAAVCKYKINQCIKVGTGMMVRGEVCLIVAQAGARVGLIQEQFFPAFILLIICSSIIVPIVLKKMFTKYPFEEVPSGNELKIPAIEAANEIRVFVSKEKMEAERVKATVFVSPIIFEDNAEQQSEHFAEENKENQ
jgi:predicted Kef-type K+ transport protein